MQAILAAELTTRRLTKVALVKVHDMSPMVRPKYVLLCGGTKANWPIAGYTYNAVASLAFLDQLPESVTQSSFDWKSSPETSNSRKTALTNLPRTIRWLLSRQLMCYNSDGDERDQNLDSLHENPDHENSEAGMPSPPASPSLSEAFCVGFNGRANKLADTCYCFWVTASLEVGTYKLRYDLDYGITADDCRFLGGVN